MRFSKIVWNWFPPIALMTLIFYFSSKQNISVTDEDFLSLNEKIIDFIVFKSIHVAEYAVLYLLFYRAYYLSFQKKWNYKRIILWSFISAISYACIDEIHQYFVPSRTGTVRDVAIDLLGISIALLYTRYYSRKFHGILK